MEMRNVTQFSFLVDQMSSPPSLFPSHERFWRSHVARINIHDIHATPKLCTAGRGFIQPAANTYNVQLFYPADTLAYG